MSGSVEPTTLPLAGAPTVAGAGREDAAAAGGFHQASAVQALVDLIEDGDGGDVAMEPGPQTIDHLRRSGTGVVTRVVRAMSCPAPSRVISSDLWNAVRRWS